jgi:protein phosphatase 1 regulatory subunit 7
MALYAHLLMDMQASYNKIEDIKSLDQQLGGIKGLETVYLEGNPAQIQDMVNYRRRIMISLPQLKQIDATRVGFLIFSKPSLTSSL